MGRRTLDAVTVVDPALARFVIDIKVLEVVVKVDAPCAEVSTEKGSVGGEDSGHVDLTLAAEGDGETRLPFVEMGDNGSGQLTGGVLLALCDQKMRKWGNDVELTSPRNHATM